MKTRLSLFLCLLALVAFGGCIDRDLRPLNPCLLTGFVENVPPRLDKVDLLFIIDNSTSMEEERDKLTAEMSDFVDALLSGSPPVNDLRVGVVTTEVIADTPDEGGRIGGTTPFCEGPQNNAGGILPPGTMERDGRGETVPTACIDGGLPGDFNDSGVDPYVTFTGVGSQAAFVEQVNCLIEQEFSGCGTEQPLEAMYQALDRVDFGEANDGFVRDDAALAIVVITDEDDCSAGEQGVPDTNPGIHQSWIYDARPFFGDICSELTLYRGGTREEDLEICDNVPFCSVELKNTGPECENPFRSDMPMTSDLFCVACNAGDPDSAPRIKKEQTCALLPQSVSDVLHPLSRYVDKITATKDSSQVVFAALAGAPSDAVMNHDTETIPTGAIDSSSDYTSLLGDPDMVVASNTSPTRAFEDAVKNTVREQLIPTCYQAKMGESDTSDDPDDYDTIAFPARRIASFARELEDDGVSTILQTICADDFQPAVDKIVEKIGEILQGQCLPRPQVRNSQDVVNCRVLEVLPVGRTCDEFTGNGRTLFGSEGVREVCLINQLAVPQPGTTPEPGDGWFYDDGPDADGCPAGVDGMSKQQVSFATDDEPIAGAEVRFECLQVAEPDVVDRGKSCVDDDDCDRSSADLEEQYSRPDLQLFCEDQSKTCQLGHIIDAAHSKIECLNDGECPGGFQCFDRDDDPSTDIGLPGVDDSQAFCIIPTCTLGLID